MGLFKTEGKPADAFAMACWREFNQLLGSAKAEEEAAEAFFLQLSATTSADTVALFLKKADGKLAVTLHGIDDPPAEISTAQSEAIAKYASATTWSLDQYGKERGTGESQKLFLAGFHTFLICPLLTGEHNLGVLKFDFKASPEVSEAEQSLLELLCERFASYLNQIQQKQELKQQRIDAWFDHTILKIKECDNRKDILRILSEGFAELKKIDPALLRSFRLYMVDFREERHYLDISTGNERLVHEAHYRPPCHLSHFAESGRDVALYTKSDCTAQGLQPFHNTDTQESLCLRTDFRPALLGLAGMAQQPVVAVLWSSEAHFLAGHQSNFLHIAKQIGATLAALPTRHRRPKGIAEGRFQYKSGEILDQLLRTPSKDALISLLMEKARELAPEAKAVSYGIIRLRKKEPCIEIRHSEGANRGYTGEHLIRNQGVWQQTWDSSETVVVNNQYDLGVPKITNAPIANPQSALCIPIIGHTGSIMGMLSLCSDRPNAFPDSVVAEVEWLVQAFASRYANLGEARTSASIGQDAPVIQCIRQIADQFAGFTPEAANYQAIFENSIAIIADSLEASSWMLVRRAGENSYEIVREKNCASGHQRHVDKLRYSPVRDLLEEEDELFNTDIRRQPKYQKLLMLLRSDQNACLAARVEVRRIVPRSSEVPHSDEAIQTTRYGVLLFHPSGSHFQKDHADFLRIALTLIQELMKRQTLASELQYLMPLTVPGAMAAQVAHEIRNPCQPLTSLIGNLKVLFTDQESLENKLSQDSYRKDLAQLLEVADSALQRINRNVSHLMHLADMKSFTPAPVAIEEVLQDVSRYEWYGEDWSPKSGRKPRSPIVIRVADDNASPAPVVRFDKIRLAMILTNLIKNAVEAINASSPRPGGDEIVIGWEWTAEKSADELPWWRRRERSAAKGRTLPEWEKQRAVDPAGYPLAIYVSDNGPGMSLATSEKLFEPFYSTKARGTGLGCTISQMLMQKISGELRVVSVVGSGTTFRLHFPKDHVIMKEGKP